jgi:hypothetical protein
MALERDSISGAELQTLIVAAGGERMAIGGGRRAIDNSHRHIRHILREESDA